jgi:chromosome partitioning protein
MKTIAVVNQKGGVGKTPTAINLGFALKRAGQRVLLIDIDPQASMSQHFLGERWKDQQPTIYNALVSLEPITPLTISEQLDFLPAHDELLEAEIKLPKITHGYYQPRLAMLLQKYPNYAYAVIDTPGNVSMFTTIALTAAHLAVVPTKTELAAERSTRDILGLIEDIRAGGLNPQLEIWGILPTLFQSNVAHHKEVLEVLRDKYNSLLYQEPSRQTTKYNDATALKADVSILDAELGKYWDRVAASVIEKGEKR